MRIGLIAREPVSALGVAAMLDLERIPYSCRDSLADTADDELALFAGGDVEPREIGALEDRPCVVLCGGEAFARTRFGASQALVQAASVRIPVDQPVWSDEVEKLAATHGIEALRIPLAPVCGSESGRPTEILARHLVGDTDAERISCARIDRCVWSAVDLGTAFVNLTQEHYAPPSAPVHAPGPFRTIAETAYYQLPEWMRRPVQRFAYSMLKRRLADLGPSRTEYPVDASGVLLLELLRSLLLAAGATVTRLDRWPAPHSSAAALTHDIEPSPYSYADGLDALLDRVEDEKHPATFGLVAEAASARLRDDQVKRLKRYQVIVHGRTHRGEPVDGRERVRAGLDAARSQVEARIERAIAGYRSPRLDRSPDLAWALDRAGFAFDSSYPDVDRENAVHFGAGVGLNLPFRPLVEGERGELRPSRCLELPLTAPDCIQPLLGGESVLALRNTIARKTAFVRATGGGYVALVHAGVFGPSDTERRMAHLDFVVSALRRDGVWLTDLAGMHRWWSAREAVRLLPCEGGIEIRNEGSERITGLRLVVEHGRDRNRIEVPPIEAGRAVRISSESNEIVTAA